MSTAVIVAVSSIRGLEPDDLEPLSSRVDPDALNAIAVEWYERDVGHDGSITFPFDRCTVTVRADGEIVVDPERSSAVAVEL